MPGSVNENNFTPIPTPRVCSKESSGFNRRAGAKYQSSWKND
ncbi:hypothetical protein [Wolbachia endosymbiont (group A) of Ennomos erosarius]